MSSAMCNNASVFGLHPCVYAIKANQMTGMIENCSKFEVQALVTFLQAEGVSESEIHLRLVNI
jgi:hypothetical protein